MKIGIDIRPLLETEPTGVGVYTFHLLDHLIKLAPQNEFHLFYNSFKTKPASTLWADKKNVLYHAWKIPNKLLNTSLAFFGWPYIDSMAGSCDVFISPNPYFSAYSNGRCVIQIVHDLSHKVFPEFFSAKIRLGHKFIYGKNFRKSHHFVAVSENTKQDLRYFYNIPEEKITVIEPGLDPLFLRHPTMQEIEDVRQKFHLPKNFILFLGTIEPRKNLETLIAAFEIWHKKYQHIAGDTELVIAGKVGWLAQPVLEYIQKFSNNKTHPKVRTLGFFNSSLKPHLYALARLFVFPSFYEGFGFPPLEALSQGTPCIISHAPSLGQIFSKHALLVDPLRPEEMADMFTEYLDVCEQIHPSAERIAFARSFKWDIAAQRLYEFLDRMLFFRTAF